MDAAKIEETIQYALMAHRTIYVRNWGATMALANFYVIKHVEGSTKKVALELAKEEYGEFGVSERTIPTDRLLSHSVHAVREKPHGEYTGLAPDTQINFSGRWETVTRWDGKPQRQNTCD